jgi:arylsulfatase A-like enzyme
MGSRRPNLLLLMADDHRSDAMSCAGDAVATPHLDALAAAGVRCRDARIMGGHHAAVCVPTRAALNTGRDPFRTSVGLGSYDEIRTLRPDAVTLGEHLGRSGWRTFHTGKWHLDGASLNRSFQEASRVFLGGMSDHFSIRLAERDPSGRYPEAARRSYGQHSTEIFAESAIRFLGGIEADQPFALSCCFTAPHDPRQAPPEWHARHRPEDMELPRNFLPEHPFDNGELRIRDEGLCPWPRTPAMIRREIADYHAIIAHLDHHIGRILAALEARGLADGTVVVYTGDHGLAVGRHGMLGKQNLYEHALRIPMILRGPGVPVGALHDGMLCNYDLFPTLCELLGLDPPAGLSGSSFAARLHDGQPHREAAYSVYRDVQAAYKRGGWKLIRYCRGADGQGCERLQLFDTVADPWELHDRSGDPGQQSRVRDLLAGMQAEQRRLGDPLAGNPPPVRG